MATFSHAYGPGAMLASVAEYVRSVEEPDTGDMDVHTVTLLLNGQHGEFDLVIEATDNDMEEHRWTGVAHRSGGVAQFGEVEV
jgi:hypothetical protein